MAVAGVMSALDRDVAMTNDRFENLALLGPQELAQAIAHPADRIVDVRVLRRVEQIGKRGPGRGRSEVKPRQSVSSRRPSSRASLRSLGWQHLIPDRARLASKYQFSSSEPGSL